MKSSDNLLSQILTGILEKKNIKEIVISPGSRNAPLIISFNQNKFFKNYTIIDERSAGFFSLGISKQTKEPAVLVCTSGSALLNYYPAVSEAYYSNIPLIIISADRPYQWLNQGDGQTIKQENVFENHVLKSYDLIEGDTEDTIWYNERCINEGINLSKKYKKPVHFNVHFSEPLYNVTENNYKARIINLADYERYVLKEDLINLKNIWEKAEKKILLIGEGNYSKNFIDIIENFLSADNSLLVLKESLSNIHSERFIGQIDKFIFTLNDENIEYLKPDLLVVLGRAIVSKKIKQLLRTYRIKNIWKFSENNYIEDTYQNVTYLISELEDSFFKRLLDLNIKKINSKYSDFFLDIYKEGLKQHKERLDKEDKFLDLKVYQKIFEKLPKNEILHLSNSMAIRYSQFFDIDKSVEVYCNRGNSGIDGSTSTAIGFSQNSSKGNTLITGDISFFYDSNALWNKYVKHNFKVIIINNGGGNIFRVISGPDNTEELEDFFETKHGTNAQGIALMHNLEYFKADNFDSLDIVLNFFWNSNTPAILEIFTDSINSPKFLKEYL